jgi:hypothetical protein
MRFSKQSLTRRTIFLNVVRVFGARPRGFHLFFAKKFDIQTKSRRESS